ncbi:LLM class flavin-dependent oxidoreductase [Paracoccus caeni]|uniref:LLM class flavin-dependent oxidoreductase n=1 Tax=Paracoccus caeni TaxID=657651 RepID=A0A934VUM3_9RHOB|nr:LLM class flavin-dependent oxidoreductase [Paracoccus caeni]MBK4215971.1 LLM class flavin-dependent oxidoreductase [Paracoccus caeni]
MKFSLFYFDGDGSARNTDAYKLLLDSARFADQNGLLALWLPERHFHAFGGLYPNPALIHSALSMVTENVQLRSGSVVLPLHHPVRVAEDWSVLDNLSGGRAGIAIASGWTMQEFILSREPHGFRRSLMWQSYEQLTRLLAGEAVEFEDADGNLVEAKTLPRPLQPRIPFWVACQSQETFVEAGRRGINVLCSLLGERIEDIAPKIRAYREALDQNGHDPDAGKVSIMVHTYLAEDPETAKANVIGPFSDYLRTHYHLLESLARSMKLDVNLSEFSEDDVDSLLKFGVEGFMNGRSLIGSAASVEPVVEALAEAGVDEIACLIDFVQDYDLVMGGLPQIAALAKATARTRRLELA